MALINHLWVVAVNKIRQEYRITHLVDEWLLFKYRDGKDIEPDWEIFGCYETIYEAFADVIK